MKKSKKTTARFWTKEEIKENRIQDEIRTRSIAVEEKRKKRASLRGKQKIEKKNTLEKKRKRRTYLPFSALPPKWSRIEDVNEYYDKLFKTHPKLFEGRVVQKDRITEIYKLKPKIFYAGRLDWLGYVIYEFDYVNNVILDCPIKDNAVYILKGSQWTSLVRFTKGKIRDKYKESYKKVVHKNGWLPRVEVALHNL